MDLTPSSNRGIGFATTVPLLFFMKKNSFYFSHDYNSSDDHKCLFLRQQLGMEGYGIFWFLVEKLAQAGGSLPLKLTPTLAIQMQVSEAKVNAVINGFELFEIHDFSFYSTRLNDHLKERKLLSESGKRGNEKRWGVNRPPNRPPNQGVIAPLIAGKESNTLVNLGIIQALELAITLESVNQFSEFYEFESSEFNNQKQEIMYVVQEMVKIYQRKDPDHFFDKETDYHACMTIAGHIAKSKNWKQAEIVTTRCKDVLASWDKITDFIIQDNWFSVKSLDFISAPKHWQELLKKMNQKKTTEAPITDYQRKLKEQLDARKKVV